MDTKSTTIEITLPESVLEAAHVAAACYGVPISTYIQACLESDLHNLAEEGLEVPAPIELAAAFERIFLSPNADRKFNWLRVMNAA